MTPKTDTAPLLWDIPVAFALLTRVPLPRLPEAAFAHQARVGWTFGLVGLVVGGVALAVALAALAVGLPAVAAAGLAVVVQIILTGAMHEDGLADTTDGLWGGWSVERRLEIMKDSAIGTYGVLALVCVVGLRWIAIAGLVVTAPGALIAAAALSRAVLPGLMHGMPNARGSGLSQDVGRPGRTTAGVALVLGLALCGVSAGAAGLWAACAGLVVVGALARLAQVRIGGQTGDILGAAQQLGEVAMLLCLLALLA